MQIPMEKLDKLLFYNQFKNALDNSALTKKLERKRKIENFILYRLPNMDNNYSEKKISTINFEEFNSAIYDNCTERGRQTNKKMTLKDHKTKIVHGSAIKINEVNQKLHV